METHPTISIKVAAYMETHPTISIKVAAYMKTSHYLY